MWSDPDGIEQFYYFIYGLKDKKNKDLHVFYVEDIEGWAVSPRGAGYLFGGDVVDEFNHTNSIDLICRAH